MFFESKLPPKNHPMPLVAYEVDGEKSKESLDKPGQLK